MKDKLHSCSSKFATGTHYQLFLNFLFSFRYLNNWKLKEDELGLVIQHWLLNKTGYRFRVDSQCVIDEISNDKL